MRKDFTSMSYAERTRYVKAYLTASTKQPYKAAYTKLIAIHKQYFSQRIHTKHEFLPWHRWYVPSIIIRLPYKCAQHTNVPSIQIPHKPCLAPSLYLVPIPITNAKLYKTQEKYFSASSRRYQVSKGHLANDNSFEC